MTIDTLLNSTIERLRDAGITTARLDCLVLLEDVLNTNRTQILAHPDRILTEVVIRKMDRMINKRIQHIPLAYIRGKTEFYGREFIINQHVLEPRPESETIIDLMASLPTKAPDTVIDVGTGSGALAITAALEHTDKTVTAIDLDKACLQLAARNAATYNVTLDFYEGDLLTPLPTALRTKPAILLCNLPYVPNSFQINTAATHEPQLAIFGGEDGLDLYRRLFTQLQSLHPGETFVFCESLPTQHVQLTRIATGSGFRLIRSQDFIQLFVRA